MRRIFAENLDGAGDRAIAAGLNRDGDPLPVGAAAGAEPAPARPTAGRRAPFARSWRTRATPVTRCSGGGRKQEELLDPDDVAAGHVTRFRRAAPEQDRAVAPARRTRRSCRSRRSRRRSWCGDPGGRGPGGAAQARTRTERTCARLRSCAGRVRCGYLPSPDGGRRRATNRVYYRCAARTHRARVADPGDAPEERVPAGGRRRRRRSTRGSASLFEPDTAMTRSAGCWTADASSLTRAARSGRSQGASAEAERRLRRLQSAIEAGRRPGSAGGADQPRTGQERDAAPGRAAARADRTAR